MSRDDALAPAARRRPTINDIARLAGVSKKTVSRIINQSPSVSAETREKVVSIIAEQGFSPDPQARGLAFRKSFLIGLIYDNPNAQFIVSIQYGILDGLRGSGFELVVRPCDRDGPTFLADVRTFIERQRLFGVVILPPVAENEALVAMLDQLDCPYVRVASAELDVAANTIWSNDRTAAAEVAAHLVALGHRRIAAIRGPQGFRSAHERWTGFRDELARRGVDLTENRVAVGGYTFESGDAAAEMLLALDPPPIAIFAANDEMAAGVYQAANLRGIAIPGDLSVIGFDDSPMALTTVRWPIREIGRIAADLLLTRPLAGAADERAPMQPRLIVRGSTAPPSS